MVAVNDKLVNVLAWLQLDFRTPDAVTIRAVHGEMRIKDQALTVVCPVIEIARQIDQVRRRGVASEEQAAGSAVRPPFRIARTGDKHVTGGADMEDGVLVTVAFVDRVGRELSIPLAVHVEFETIDARIELHGFAPDTVGVGPIHRE